jgi:peptidyl-prolyl cis-trans isomerase C
MHFSKSIPALSLACAILVGGAIYAADEPAKTTNTGSTAAAKVNGVVIPQSRVDVLAKQRAAQGQPDSPDLRKNLREHLISSELLAQEASKKGLEKNPDVAAQMDLARQGILVQAYVQDYLKQNPVSEEVLKADYEKIKGQLGDKEYKARHVLVETEKEAKDVIAQLKKGVKFDKLANEKSKDMGSKTKGGDLDWVAPGRLAKPFAEALTKLKKGQYTQEPVKTEFGWHVIKLEDERPLQAPAYEQVKPTLTQRHQAQQVDKLLEDLRKNAKIE